MLPWLEILWRYYRFQTPPGQLPKRYKFFNFNLSTIPRKKRNKKILIVF